MLTEQDITALDDLTTNGFEIGVKLPTGQFISLDEIHQLVSSYSNQGAVVDDVVDDTVDYLQDMGLDTQEDESEDLQEGSGFLTKGTKEQVWRGIAQHTAGGLRKVDLMLNKAGKVVSRKQHEAGKKLAKFIYRR